MPFPLVWEVCACVHKFDECSFDPHSPAFNGAGIAQDTTVFVEFKVNLTRGTVGHEDVDAKFCGTFNKGCNGSLGHRHGTYAKG